MDKKIIMIGNGGHSKVLLDILRIKKIKLFAVSALTRKKNVKLNFFTHDEIIEKFSPADIVLINGIGSIPNQNSRWQLDAHFRSLNYSFLTIIHPSTIISEDTSIGQGVQIMAGAIIQPGSIIGQSCIINTGSTIDHDCNISANCHIAPGVNISGGVSIGPNSHIGTGAKIIQGISIGENVTVAAGVTVYKNLSSDNVYKGG